MNLRSCKVIDELTSIAAEKQEKLRSKSTCDTIGCQSISKNIKRGDKGCDGN